MNIGDKYNFMTIVKFLPDRKVLVLCDCGNEKIIQKCKISNGTTKSCGCYRKIFNKCLSKGRNDLCITYGSMKYRCYNPNHVRYESYGGRGINVCDEWKNNSDSFYDWAIENGYKKGLQLDRIDNNGNYCPENCRFVSVMQNARNKRNNVRFFGKTTREWIEFYNIKYSIKIDSRLRFRLKKGLNIEEAIYNL